MKKLLLLYLSIMLCVPSVNIIAQDVNFIVKLHPKNPPQKVKKEKYKVGEIIYVPTIIDEPFGIPTGMLKYEGGKIATVDQLPDFNTKMVVWIDSTKCASCHLDYLHVYNDLVDYCNNELQEKAGLVVIISPKLPELPSLKNKLLKNSYNFPIFLDINREIEKLNPMIVTNQFESDQCIMLYDGGKVYSIVYNKNDKDTEVAIRLCKSQIYDAVHYKKKRRQ